MMTNTEIRGKIETAIFRHNERGGDWQEHFELINCQPFGIDNESLNSLLGEIPCGENGHLEAIQSIVHFYPSTK